MVGRVFGVLALVSLVAICSFPPTVAADGLGPADTTWEETFRVLGEFGGCISSSYTFYQEGNATGPYHFISSNLTFIFVAFVVNNSNPADPNIPPETETWLINHGVPPWVFSDKLNIMVWVIIDLTKCPP